MKHLCLGGALNDNIASSRIDIFDDPTDYSESSHSARAVEDCAAALEIKYYCWRTNS